MRIDSRLAQLNCKLCLLTIDESTLEKRIVQDRNPGWREYLRQYGDTDADILDHYFEQQDLFGNLCAKTRLGTLILKTSDSSIQDTVGQVAGFWGAL